MTTDATGGSAPEAGGGLVSILVVARNTGPFIGAAIQSARDQSYRDLEILVLDDASTDDTRAVAERHAAQDSRVRVLDGPQAGLAAIRNASLEAATGRWAAILDSDDLLHPRHVERLVAAARETGAEITAANMVAFRWQDDRVRTALFADREGWRTPRWIDLVDYIRANHAFGDSVSAGYLKPLFDLAFLRAHRLGYDPRLRIAEDYDLVARAMMVGARFRYVPTPTYFYRQHAASTSHRQSVRDLSAMLDSAIPDCRPADPMLAAALERRARSIAAALRHARAVDALKARRPGRALQALGDDATAWRLMAGSAREGAARRLRRRTAAGAPAPDGLLLGAMPVTDEAPTGMIARAMPTTDHQRAALADGLTASARIVIAPGVSADDAAYLLPVTTASEPG